MEREGEQEVVLPVSVGTCVFINKQIMQGQNPMMINYMNNKMSKTFDAPWKSERKYKEGTKQ